MRAIVCAEPGGPEVLTIADVPTPPCGPDQVRVRIDAIGVNFIETYQRSGIYPVQFPWTPGGEAAGTVVEAGENVTWAAVGDRLAWAQGRAVYAEEAVVEEHQAFQLPDGIETTTAAALMLQGLTAHYLVTSSFPVRNGHTVLLHAGAGGVGLLLTQLATARGARVITTVSTDEKEALSRAAGAAEVIRYDRFTDLTTELPEAVKALTGGRGVDAVFDGVGKSTFDGSLASLAVRGSLVLFGAASGPVPPFDLQRLNAAGSVTVSRPSLGHFLLTPEERAWRAGELFDAVLSGALTVRIGATFPLEDAAEAHRALAGRRTTGKVLLLP